MRINSAAITDDARNAINTNSVKARVRSSTARSLERFPWVDLPISDFAVGRDGSRLVLADGRRIAKRRQDTDTARGLARWLIVVEAA